MSIVSRTRNEIPTIDVNLVTIETKDGKEFGFDTANKVEVEVQTEDTDAVKLVVKGILRAQKPKESTITGHKITLTDNVLIPQLVKVLQGGTIYYWQDANHTSMSTTETKFGAAKYTPPVAGSGEKGEVFKLNLYSAQYNAAGIIVNYEKTSYPNCKGVPVALNSEDGTFRAPEYEIDSAPNEGEVPYTIEWVDKLPELVDPDKIPAITIPAGEILGVDTSEMGDYIVNASSIDGVAKLVNNYVGFSSDVSMQNGYYIALNVDKWDGNSFRLDRTTGSGNVVTFKDDGNVVLFLGADAEAVATAKQFVAIIDGTEIKYDLNITVAE